LAHGCSLGRERGLRVITASLITVLASMGGIAQGAGGGASAPATPKLKDVICTAGCVGLRAPTAGGTVQVSGSNLVAVSKMSFPATGGGRTLTDVISVTETSASAKVPADAADGQVRVRDDFGHVSNFSPTSLDIRPQSELGSSGALTLLEAEVSPHKAFFYGVRAPSLTYVIGSSQQLNDLRVDVVDADGVIVRSFFPKDVPANSTQTQHWGGKTSAGKAAPTGSYSFRVSSAAGARASQASARRMAMSFQLYGFILPVRGPHDYGSAGARFGAPRSGHTHQGQDVLADCGTPLVAARGGRVQYAGYEGSAGNYIVIDGKATGRDFVYMHLRSPALFKEGQTVHTGQRIGDVGETGDATGCHLHFEMWSPPGWYEGGAPFDPLPYLKKWDSYS
jgi:murein DD-endopeptidase MepM/ murein hydrolase activator NlpD